jgi:hypothetical protein
MIMMISRKSLALINNKVIKRLSISSSSLISSLSLLSSSELDDSIIEKDGSSPIQADTVSVKSPFLKTLFERG